MAPFTHREVPHGVSTWRVGIILLAMVACAPGDPRGAGTIRMAQVLDSIADAEQAKAGFYNNAARVAYLRANPPAPDLQSRMLHRGRLAQELLQTGRSEDAIREFEGLRRDIEQFKEVVPREFFEITRELLAISYLRLGEQENCVLDHTSRRCLLPISREAIHQKERGSRGAIALYEEILRDDPSDMSARWLLNVAYMTVGEHPDSVPPAYLIPPDAFESDHDILSFPDVAPQLGLAVVGLAGGAITEDFDGDGYLDIVASSWGLRDQIRFFRSLGTGQFEDRTVAAGLEGIVSGLQINHTDYNNDGHPDILVLRGGWLTSGHPNSLLRNNGDGTFEDVTVAAGLAAPTPTQAAAWADFDNDGWVDLFVGNETQSSETVPSQLFRNNGDGTFRDVAVAAGVAVVGFVKGVAWGDYDNDGRMDLYVSRLGQPNVLLHNEGPDARGQWRFRNTTLEAGVADPVESFPTWFFDYDNDGWQDLFVSGYRATAADITGEYLGMPHQGVLPKLYRNNGDGTFADATVPARVNKIMLTMGSNFGDLDNDGFQDFYIGTGEPDFRALMPNRMYRNSGEGFFQDVTTSGGFGHLQKGHGVAFGDLDHDGDQDVYTVIGGAFEGDVFQNALFANPGHGNRWITVRLVGVESNRAAIGARVRVDLITPAGERTVHTTVSTGGSFGSNSLQVEIGLGDATAIRAIAVTWPATGRTDTYPDVAMNQIVQIREGDASPTPVAIRPFDLAAVAGAAPPAPHNP